MNLSDLQELKQLALQAELARPLTHECNNFLNNLLLQLAISEKSFPESIRAEWTNVRREAKKLASLLQQWQRQRKRPSEGPARMEFNQLVQEAVEEIHAESAAIRFLLHPASEPLGLVGFKGDVQRLIFMLLHYAIVSLEGSEGDSPAVEIAVARSGTRILLQLRSTESADVKLAWTDFDDLASSERTSLSLPALMCKSLVERLEGEIRIIQDAQRGTVLIIDLPLALS